MNSVARRPYEDDGKDDGMLPPMDPGSDAVLRSRPRVRGVAPASSPVSRGKIVLRVLGAVAVLGTGLYGFHRVEQFLIRDPRFALNGTDGATSTLEIRGASHVSVGALEAAFREDSGRSVYLMPLADRRAALRNVNWVKDAAVARAWPNRILVQVSERDTCGLRHAGAFALRSDRRGRRDSSARAGSLSFARADRRRV